jgi:acetolactate synthase-1/2/3 large subunit
MSEYSKSMLRVSDYIMNFVYDNGVEHIFTVTGRGALFLSDAVAKHTKLDSISMHHEQGAAFAAVAYAQYNERLGACLVSTGCAGTNTITGVLSAWQDGIPCMFISGQNTLKETTNYTGIPLRTYGQQEADIIPIVKSITKYAVMISDPNMIRYELEKALYLAQEGRKGPVWIDVPLDIQSMRIDPEELLQYVPSLISDFSPINEDLEFLAQKINESNRPIVLIGGGIRSAKAVTQFRDFIEKYKIPVVYTASAVDTYCSDNLLSLGSVGSMGCSRAGNFALQNSDLLIVLGNRLSTITTGADYCKFAREAKIVVIDIDRLEHTKETIKIDKFIKADVFKLLEQLLLRKIKVTNNIWIDKCLHWKKVFSQREESFKSISEIDLYDLSEKLSNTLPKNSVLVTDSGFIEVILPTNIKFKDGQRSIHPISQGAMGYALPAAIGAYFASKKPIIVVVGDGSIMMNIQEFETIRYHKIPLKIFVVNNNAYAIIRKRQIDLFRKRTIGTDVSNGLSCPDFEKVALCFDLKYQKIVKAEGLEKNIINVLNEDRSVLCEVIGKENQEYIEVSITKNTQKAIVRRPLEDQSPFLERDFFLTEMIITPIDQ